MRSEFEKRVFGIVKKIPKGGVLTYKEVARMAGRPRCCRQVGNILSRNQDAKMPCHRVIRTGGQIGGYNKGVSKKAALLKKEGVVLINRRVEKFE